EIAGDFHVVLIDFFYGSALESDCGIFLGRKKILALEMLVAVWIGGVDVCRLELDIKNRLCGIRLINLNRAGWTIDSPIKVVRVEMLNPKHRGGMDRINLVCVGSRDQRQAKHQKNSCNQWAFHVRVSFV